MEMKRGIVALLIAAGIIFLFFNASQMLQNYSLDPFGLIRPYAWLAPLVNTAGLLIGGLVFLFIMLPRRKNK